MRIAFDLDGTVADLRAALDREARELFPDIDPGSLPNSVAAIGDPAAPAPPDDAKAAPGSALTSRQQNELWAAVRERVNFWETLDEIEPGLLARLFRVVQERKWEVIFLTSRPETRGDTAQLQSYRWLAAHGYKTPSIFVVHGSRGRIASALALDIVVDDRPENCLDVAIDSSARAILVWRGDTEQVPGSARQLGIGAVGSIGECLDVLQELDDASADGTGIVERLKRLLGLKSRPGAARQSSVASR
jgi:hypothetical protein